MTVVTSRTGTATYLRHRSRVIRKARVAGLVCCPGFDDAHGVHHECGVELDWETPGLPNSAEVDHVIEARYGGTDDVDNLRVLCRACNALRNRVRPVVAVAEAEAFRVLRPW